MIKRLVLLVCCVVALNVIASVVYSANVSNVAFSVVLPGGRPLTDVEIISESSSLDLNEIKPAKDVSITLGGINKLTNKLGVALFSPVTVGQKYCYIVKAKGCPDISDSIIISSTKHNTVRIILSSSPYLVGGLKAEIAVPEKELLEGPIPTNKVIIQQDKYKDPF